MHRPQIRTTTKVPADLPPAPPAPGTPVSGGLLAPSGGSPGELAMLTYRQLLARLNELQNLRQKLAGRRDALAGDYERSSGANREGIGQRLQTLDHNIVVYEQQIAAVGQEMAAKAPTSFGSSQPGNFNRYNQGDIAGAMFGTFLTTLIVVAFVGRRIMRRRFGRMPAAQSPNMMQSNERLDRIEQAVDTIAVEIERVSENQRFMTRLMTETKLGDNLKG